MSVRGGLTLESLHAGLVDPALTSMTFLNEVAERYPEAVSFAAGRPNEDSFDVASVDRWVRRFCEHLRTDLGYGPAQVNRTLLQYGRTKGVIHGLVARNLAVDEGVVADPEALVVTVGCQEAMWLVLRALTAGPEDVLLAVEPTYVGLTGAARLLDLPVAPVRSGRDGIDLADLAARVRELRASGRRVRACYVMPDFANPSGLRMTREHRQALLDTAHRLGLLLLEDNPYGLFGFDDRLPTLKALDTRRDVVYLGSFAKTGVAGARVGYVLADQVVTASDGTTDLLADHLARIKSMLTVNTSPIAQAVVAGKILEHDGSLLAANEREREVYRANTGLLLDRLGTLLAGTGVRWTAPRGGFFTVLDVPFVVDDAALEDSASRFGVLWTPMHHFFGGSTAARALRLSCSSVTTGQIELGARRLAAFVHDRIGAPHDLGHTVSTR